MQKIKGIINMKLVTRNFSRYGFLLAIIAILPYSTTKAQDTLSLNLGKAVEIALSESPTIKVADKEIKRVDYSNKERFSSLFPAISATGSYSRALKKQKMFFDIPGFPSNPDGIEVGQDNTFTGGFSASLPIIAPTLWATLKMNDTDAKLALETARSSKLSLLNQVTKAYYSVLLAQDSYNVFDRTYQSSTENARIIGDKYKQGTVSEFEWIRADVQARNAQSNLVSAASAVNLSFLQLKMLMGVEMDVPVKVEGKLSDYEDKMYGDLLNTTIDTTNLSANTDLKQLDIKTKQLEQSLDVLKTQWLPTLSASLNYQYMSMANDSVKFSNYNWFPTSTFGLSLSIPLFQGGSKHYKLKQTNIQLSEMQDQRDNLRRSIQLQAITSIDNMKKALEQIESNKKALTQAEKALVISQKRYDVGAGTYLDVTNSEVAYVQAGLSYNQSIYDYLSAKSDLEKLLGKENN